MSDKPYKQKNVTPNKFIREFSGDINTSELTWHRDKNNRLIRVLNENDWLIQFDNELPIKLIEGEYLHIPEKMFHRVIKGKSNLIIEIEEFDLAEVLVITEAKKKKKSTKKDACYHKVKSRYKVWPSAYASGALVKCRKVGAKNWGNSTKESEVIQEESLDSIELYEDKKRKLTSKPSSEDNLGDWFKRKGEKGSTGGWVDCNTCRKDSKTGKTKCKSCGREKGEKRSKYPACRPTPGACKKYKETKGKSWGKKSKTNENLDKPKKSRIIVNKGKIEHLIKKHI